MSNMILAKKSNKWKISHIFELIGQNILRTLYKRKIIFLGLIIDNFISFFYRINTDDNSGTLQIGEARASDAGEYTCEVSSAGGNDRRSASLDVIELPYAPTHVHAEKVSTAHKTVNVSWTPGFNGNSPVIKFILQYRYDF